MNKLNINFHKLCVLLLPICLRRPILMALFKVFSVAFDQILVYLTKYRTETLEELKYNGQVCRMEYLLNNIFDLEQRRIQVIDGQQLNGNIFYLYERNTTTIIDMIKNRNQTDQIILNNRETISQQVYDFYILIPASLTYNPNKLKAIVNTYKTTGKSWKIKTI